MSQPVQRAIKKVESVIVPSVVGVKPIGNGVKDKDEGLKVKLSGVKGKHSDLDSVESSQYQQFWLNQGKCPRNLQLSTEQFQSEKSQYEKEVE